MAFAAVGVRPFVQQMAACSCAGGESSAKRLQGKPPDGKDYVLFVASFCAFVNPNSYIFPHSKALHFHSSQPLLGLKQNVKSSLSFSCCFFLLFFLKTNVWETKRFLGSRDKLGRASWYRYAERFLHLEFQPCTCSSGHHFSQQKKTAPRFIPTSSELLTMKDGAIEQYTNIYNNVPLPTDITSSSRRAQHIPRNL